ncbi:ferredoxin [Gordonia amarae]|uniref:Ferredoxin n=2 Tax=Gordonia amarae TaxID=36821 RepID=A0A857KN40_9ACTN|nr:ferredoxin [Gordonia amarae]MCS3880481.1 ferredoxin [Gordonia amarae]QHN18811.1 ferredoxin [Gordonia amarae]QHN23286.1 ferredoxin [Gordonia amarae]QHN32187.1 ferredoxin [Gordonia amarae]QHN40934.1 ferredoxin [Gordonia amarae]
MLVTIDLDKCAGHARCYAVAAEYFDIDDDGYAAAARVIVPEGAENLAIEAVAACPERAIQICEASEESKSA